MEASTVYYGIAALATGGSVLVAAYRFLVKRLRSKIKQEYAVEVERGFIHAMATNHLPHIYDALKLIAEKIDVELNDPPPIEFAMHQREGKS